MTQKTKTTQILSNEDLKNLPVYSYNGKKTETHYFECVSNLSKKEREEKGSLRCLNSTGRKNGLEIYQTTTGCEDIGFMLEPKIDAPHSFIEITMFHYLGSDTMTLKIFNDFIDDGDDFVISDKRLLFRVIKDLLLYQDIILGGNPVYPKK